MAKKALKENQEEIKEQPVAKGQEEVQDAPKKKNRKEVRKEKKLNRFKKSFFNPVLCGPRIVPLRSYQFKSSGRTCNYSHNLTFVPFVSLLVTFK